MSTSSLQTYKRLLTYAYPFWWALLLVILGYVINAGSEVYSAELIKNITDAFNQENRSELQLLPIKIILLFFVKGCGTFLGVYFSAVIAKNMVYKIRVQAFEHILNLPNQYFLTHSSGTLSSKLIYDVEQVTAAGTDALRTILREGFIIIGLLCFLLYTNWRLSLILFAMIPIMAVVISIASKRFKAFSKNVQDSMGTVSHIISEVIGGVEVVKNFGGNVREQERFQKASKDNLVESLKVAMTGAISVPITQMIVVSAMAVVMFVALRPSVLGNSSAGEFIAYITACIMLSKPIRKLTAVNEKIQRGIAAATSLFILIDSAKEKDTGTQKTHLTGSIEFQNVGLSYDETPALQDINLTIQAGQTVAFVGRSGAGKTSLIRLLSRSNELTTGHIFFEDVQGQLCDITDLTLSSLRSQQSTVSQKVVLFDTTIKENIAYGELALSSQEQTEQASKSAYAHDFIKSLPHGYDTKVGAEGLSLSGGQRQRIAIARALLKDAPILILDEATSALDNESEHHIQTALDNAMQGRTTLVIAHRLSTIENADMIVVMDKGRIVEQGSHTELLKKEGLYANMHARDFT